MFPGNLPPSPRGRPRSASELRWSRRRKKSVLPIGGAHRRELTGGTAVPGDPLEKDGEFIE